MSTKKYDSRALIECTSGIDCSLTIDDVRRKAWGKTHFFDEGTTRFFGSRYSRILQDGSTIRMVESARVGWQGTRKFRVVTFDVLTGEVEHLETWERTAKAALRARADFDTMVSWNVEKEGLIAVEVERVGP